MITKAEQRAEQKAARELIKTMSKPRKYTVYLNDSNKTVIQTNCIELEDKGKKIARFKDTAKILTNKI